MVKLKHLFLPLLFAALLCTACSDDDDSGDPTGPTGDPSGTGNGTLAVQIDGNDYSASGTMTVQTVSGKKVAGISVNSGGEQVSISLNNYQGKGEYSNFTGGYMLAGSQVPMLLTGNLTITESNSSKVSGSFSGTAVNVQTFESHTFSNGTFSFTF